MKKIALLLILGAVCMTAAGCATVDSMVKVMPDVTLIMRNIDKVDNVNFSINTKDGAAVTTTTVTP